VSLLNFQTVLDKLKRLATS